VITVRLFGLDLEATPEAHPTDLRAAAIDCVRVIESALMPQRLGEDRLYTASERAALSMLADTAASLVEVAAERSAR
jgi:hypothetical protein